LYNFLKPGVKQKRRRYNRVQIQPHRASRSGHRYRAGQWKLGQRNSILQHASSDRKIRHIKDSKASYGESLNFLSANFIKDNNLI